jgi:peroxiredoxin Q/BCP
MADLEKGQPAPDFALPDENGRIWRLSELRGGPVIIYFYPADDTPGCTAEACDFRDAHSFLADEGYLVFGISPQDAASHRAFARKHALNFPLLVDEDLHVAERYGARRAREGSWQSRAGKDVALKVRRSTFVIDPSGRVAEAFYDVTAKGHVEMRRELLSAPAAGA